MHKNKNNIPPKDDAPTGYLHSVESGAAVDGPGMRFVYFMSGCMFRCQYCHNPDTWKIGGGRKVTLDEALDELRPYRKFLKFAGGVTISGGEPLVQARFVGELLRRIKKDFDLHTALDTQGFLHASVDDAWFDAVDLVLLDIKHSDPEKYLKLTGQALQPTLDFAQRLARLQKKIGLRYVLVPGLTDDDDDILRLADFLAGLGPVLERVDVLPFHQLGAFKWKELGHDYPLEHTQPPSIEAIDHARSLFASKNLITR
ncbi:MAG: pyruvate formate-lyase-activating protein [Alphaproteobacteria bacterium]|nr:pyruvate formate-lyase-activating protein [Alphaproteobacteria bacterium]